jgi:hypothetical protein
VGVGEARSRTKRPSVSVHVAGPRGPAGARQSPFRLLSVGVVLGTILFEPLRTDQIEFQSKTTNSATQVWAIAFITADPPDFL